MIQNKLSTDFSVVSVVNNLLIACLLWWGSIKVALLELPRVVVSQVDVLPNHKSTPNHFYFGWNILKKRDPFSTSPNLNFYFSWIFTIRPWRPLCFIWLILFVVLHNRQLRQYVLNSDMIIPFFTNFLQ